MRLYRLDPFGIDAHLIAVEPREHCVKCGTEVADHGRRDRPVTVDLAGIDVELDKLHRFAPFALAPRQQPVETSSDKDHNIGLLHHHRAA